MTISIRCFGDEGYESLITANTEAWDKLEQAGFWRKHLNGSDYPELRWEKRCLIITKRIQHAGLIETFDATFPKNNPWKIVTLAALLRANTLELSSITLKKATRGQQYSQLRDEISTRFANGTPGTPEFNKDLWKAFLKHSPYRTLSPSLFTEQAYRNKLGIIPGEEKQTGWGCINGLNIFLYGRIWQIFGLDPQKASANEIRQKYEELTASLSDNDPNDIALKGRLAQLRDSILAIF
jgi:hypothetical protein